MRVSWPVAFCETEPMNHSKRCQTAAKPLRRSNAFCSMCRWGKIMNIDEKSLQFRSSMHLWFLFLSQELEEKRQRTSLFSYRTSVLHIFVRPNESKSGTSFKVFVVEPAVVNYPGLDIVIFTIKLRGTGRWVCLLSKLENTFLWKRISNEWGKTKSNKKSPRPIRTMENMKRGL